MVGAGLDSGSPEADLTVGTTPVVGHHSPSRGTGISFSSRLFHPPPSLPVLPG